MTVAVREPTQGNESGLDGAGCENCRQAESHMTLSIGGVAAGDMRG